MPRTLLQLCLRKLAFVIIIIAVIATPGHLYAQHDYLVTKNNDTVYGKIRVNRLSGNVRLHTADGTVRVDDNNDKEYFCARDRVTMRRLVIGDKQQIRWARVLEDGRLKLYERVRREAKNHYDTRWFVQKGDATSYPIKRNGIGGNLGRRHDNDLLRDLLSDNNAVAEEYSKHPSYSFRNIRKLVREYNQATTPTHI